ncbi:hypothetical protein GCM10020219_043680 [Nonomuraea dietziae]
MNSGLSVAIVLGLSVIDVSQTAMMNLGWEEIRLTHPVFIGDTLYAESKVLAKRESGSRPYAGIVTCATRGLNQEGDEVMSWRRTVMVYKRDAPHDKGYFPTAKKRTHVMNFELDEDQQLFRATLREFVDKEIVPVASEWERSGRYPAEIVERFKELGSSA